MGITGSMVKKVVDNTTTCEFCKREFPLDRTECPHCFQPSLFPNVSLAKRDEERQKLHDRYQESKTECRERGCEDTLTEFERVCDTSVAVFNCATLKLFRQIASGTDLFETYHDLERLRLRSEGTGEHDWQKLRPQAEIELLGNHQHLDKLHYAALSLNGVGVDSYGDCTVTLREEMISHRASCFEGNTALIYEEKHDFSGSLRTSWAERAKLCAAKIGGKLDDSMSSGDFPGMLLSKGITQDDDEFVEVHIFGTMTAQTFQSVAVDSSKVPQAQKSRMQVLWKAIKEKLIENGIVAQEI